MPIAILCPPSFKISSSPNMPSYEPIQKALSLIENDESKILGLKFGDDLEIENGMFVDKAALQSAPTITLPPSITPSQTSPKSYIIIALDIDAPYPSLTVLGPILHWIQSDLTVSTSSSETLQTTTTFIANYIPPGKVPGSAPHRYLFLLYEQSGEVDVKKWAPRDGAKLANWSRMRTNLGEWEGRLGLGGGVVGGCWFRSE